jgi:chitinase
MSSAPLLHSRHLFNPSFEQCTVQHFCGAAGVPECASVCGYPPPSPPSFPPPLPYHPGAAPAPPPRSARVVQYYAAWSTYGRNFFPNRTSVEQLTHVNYAFFDVDASCRVASADTHVDYHLQQTAVGQSVQGSLAAFRAIRARRAAHGASLSLAITIGGRARSAHFSSCVATATGRQTIVTTSVELLREISFDGIDLDWEHPAANEWSNYLLLLAQYRQALNAAFPNVHKELTVAMGMTPALTSAAPKQQLAHAVDAINLMTYDYNGAWSAIAAHSAPLYADPAFATAGGDARLNIDWGVRQWLDGGVSPSKLVLGLSSCGQGVLAQAEYGTAAGGAEGSLPYYQTVRHPL